MENTAIKLSIIVPIYNVENYLPRCVDSLLDQDLVKAAYEIILVDDGSTDASATIADAYAAQFGNVRTIHQFNMGLSAARNAGLRIARGEYVQFVDSDDYLESCVLGSLLAKMDTEHLDVLRFDYQNVDEHYCVFEPYRIHRSFVDYTDEIVCGLSFLTDRLGYGCYAWQFMIRTRVLQNCLFTEGIYFEDTDWTPRMLARAKYVTSVRTIVYNYLMRRDSITQSISVLKRQKLFADKLFLLDSLSEQMADKVDKRWYQGMIAATIISVLGMIATDFFRDRKDYLEKVKAKNVYPLSTFHTSARTKYKIWLINFSPCLYCRLVHLRTAMRY